MRITALDILRCPFCAGSLALRAGAEEDKLGVSFAETTEPQTIRLTPRGGWC